MSILQYFYLKYTMLPSQVNIEIASQWNTLHAYFLLLSCSRSLLSDIVVVDLQIN